MPRVTMTQTAAREVLLTVNLGGGREVTLPLRLIDDGFGGVWANGKLDSLMKPADALRLATSSKVRRTAS